MNKEIMIIKNVRGYQDENGVAQLNLEDVSKGLGFTRTAKSGNEVIRWERIRKHLKEFGVPTSGHDENSIPTSGEENKKLTGKEGLPEYIPENIFYKLCFKAENEVARRFQDVVTDEVLPSIRRNGGYLVGQEQMTEDEILAKAIIFANNKINELKKNNQVLEVQNSQLTVANEMMKPKADYFDELVDKNLLTNFTETAKELKIKRKIFINFLLEKKYVFRNKKGKLEPYANKNDGLFEVKESKNEKTSWAGVQTLITPKGRETFRILCQGL